MGNISANNIIYIDRDNFKVYYQGTADNDDLGSLEGQGKTIEEAIDIAQNIVEEYGEVEYGINFISSRKYPKKHTNPTRPSSSKHYKPVEDNHIKIPRKSHQNDTITVNKDKKTTNICDNKKPLDKNKLDLRTRMFIEFFESQGVTFVDVTDEVEFINMDKGGRRGMSPVTHRSPSTANVRLKNENL